MRAASSIGAPSFSAAKMAAVMAATSVDEAPRSTHLKGCVLSPLRAFYLATLAGAQALGLEAAIGNFEVGKEADCIVLDPACTPLIARRMAGADSLAEQLFVWQTLGDDRAISHTYVHGRLAWQRPG